MMETSNKSQEIRAARFWGLFIVGLMGINLFVAGIAMYIAIGDPSFRPMPSYGAKSIDWETQKRIQAESDALGWKTTVERTQEPLGVVVRVLDGMGKPVAGASGTLQAYHFTRADEVRSVPFEESKTESGSYFAALDVSKDGRWQILMQLARSEGENYFMDREIDWYP